MKGGNRRKIYVRQISDYAKLLELSYNYYKEYYPDERRTRNQIRKIGTDCLIRVKKDKKITKPLLNKVSDYIKLLTTYDKKEIQPNGRTLLAFMKELK